MKHTIDDDSIMLKFSWWEQEKNLIFVGLVDITTPNKRHGKLRKIAMLASIPAQNRQHDYSHTKSTPCLCGTTLETFLYGAFIALWIPTTFSRASTSVWESERKKKKEQNRKKNATLVSFGTLDQSDSDFQDFYKEKYILYLELVRLPGAPHSCNLWREI
jgi:hypothetical protein